MERNKRNYRAVHFGINSIFIFILIKTMNYLINKTNTRMHVMNLSTNQSLHSPCRYQSVNFLFCLVPNKSLNAFNFAFLLTGNNFFSLLEG